AFRDLRREINEWNTRGSDGVIGCHPFTGVLDRDKAIRDLPSSILGDLSLKVSVERIHATSERCTVMLIIQLLEPKGTHAGPKTSKRRFMARRNAGEGAGGFKSESAIWR